MIRIFKHYIPFSLVLVGIFEICIFFSAVPLARYINQHDSNKLVDFFYTEFVYTLVVIFSMAAAGLYSRHLRENFRGVLFRVILVLIVTFFVMSFLFYLHPDLFTARTSFVYALIITGSTLIITRTLLFLMVDQEYFKKRIIVYGAGKKASHMNDLRRKSDTRNVKLMGFLPIEGEDICVDENQLVHYSNGLFNYISANNISEIIVAIDDRRKKFPVDDVLECKVQGVEILDISTFFERQTGRIKLHALHPSNLIFSDGFIQGGIDLYLKRLFDIVTSFILLLVTWPVMLITALAIMLESNFKGSIFYKQVRVGLFNKNFDVIKFRSMGMDAEKNGAQFAQAADPRVTRVGDIIRKLRIDELPQLFNVLRGDMSFVGPRPERPEFVQELSEAIKYYEIRHYVKPGITGWAQICYPYGATQEDTRNKLEYDLYYMKNYSIFLDIMILLQTIQVVVWRQG
ncbi:MAG: TIGR03013 family PEP-CTERM/XrtA system glycosyltransferase, partial [Gammaproteobacteria bacterium]|nr:TIGR03013 family PEP-CTERM/XrtA system glycosyltransferase [Gammaproteobacteria bacterium]